MNVVRFCMAHWRVQWVAVFATCAVACAADRTDTGARDANVVDATAARDSSPTGSHGDGGGRLDGGSDGSTDATDGGGPSAPTLARVLYLVRISDDAEALEVLTALPRVDREAPGIRYLRGRLLERLDRPDEAAAAFELPDDALPHPVSIDAQRRRLLLLAATNRCDEARDITRRLGVALRAGRWGARRAVASCDLRAGRHESAARELRLLLDTQRNALDEWAIGTQLADALAALGRPEEATSQLRALLVAHPEHAEAKIVTKRLTELGGQADFTITERLVRAKRLLARRRIDEAMAELDPSTRPTRPGQLARWLHLRGMALYRSRHHYAEAAKALASAARRGGPTAIDDAFHSARALSRADLDDEAIRGYRKLVRAHPRHDRATDAEYLAAWLELRLGRPQGEANMQKFLSGPRAAKSPRYRREATWHLAFRAFEKGRNGAAGSLFGRYARLGKGGLVRGRGLYWQARAFEKLGRAERAAKIYRAAIAVEPFHWYALLARQRLEALELEPGAPILPATPGRVPTPLSAIPLPPEVAFYSALGLDEDAISALRAREPALRKSIIGQRELEALVDAYHRIGGFRRAYRITAHEREALRRAPGPRTEWLWNAAYPRPHNAVVKRWSVEYGVDPAQVYATMRQESGYAPHVVSHADAIGLLQMLPSTAEALSTKMGVEVNRQKLFDPAFNIRIGIYEISGLLESFDGNVPLTICAYNAGEKRVRRWLRETGPIELDRFVERIPFDETRGYVRRVTTHLARYRYLEDRTRPWGVTLPEKVGP